MDNLFIIIKILLLIFLLGIPFIFLRFARKRKSKYKFGIYFLVSIFVTIIFVFVSAWFSNVSDETLLNHYGYNFDALSDTERYKNISNKNLVKVYVLERNYLGIGWPLKAFFGSAIFIPYSLLVFIIGFFLVRRKTKLNP